MDLLPNNNNDKNRSKSLKEIRLSKESMQNDMVSFGSVDKTKFTLDGNECDKIGVGFFAFNSQSEKCNVEAGSCLNNQIYHLYESDIQKMQQGKNPEYLLKYDKNYEYIFN